MPVTVDRLDQGPGRAGLLSGLIGWLRKAPQVNVTAVPLTLTISSEPFSPIDS